MNEFGKFNYIFKLFNLFYHPDLQFTCMVTLWPFFSGSDSIIFCMPFYKIKINTKLRIAVTGTRPPLVSCFYAIRCCGKFIQIEKYVVQLLQISAQCQLQDSKYYFVGTEQLRKLFCDFLFACLGKEPIQKGVNSKTKEFASRGAYSFQSELSQQRRKAIMLMAQLLPFKVHSFTLNQGFQF